MPWIVPALVGAVGLVVGRHAWRALRGPRGTLARATACTVVEAEEGALVAIRGQVEAPREPLVAPLTGAPCVAWRVEFQRRQEHDDQATFLPHAEHESEQPFRVGDDTGAVEVPALKVGWTMADTWQTGSLDERARDFLALRGHGSSGALRWREERLVGGQAVVVAGVARWTSDPDAAPKGYRERGRRLRLDAPDVGWIEVAAE